MLNFECVLPFTIYIHDGSGEVTNSNGFGMKCLKTFKYLSQLKGSLNFF
jgi:hypothetical protein